MAVDTLPDAVDAVAAEPSASADTSGQMTDGGDQRVDAPIEVVPVPHSEVLPELSRTLATVAQACRDLQAANAALATAKANVVATLNEAIELRLQIRDTLVTKAQGMAK